MKKISLSIIYLYSSLIIFIPNLTKAAGLVTCTSGCTLDKLTEMSTKIYSFIVDQIAAPLGTLAILIGAVLMMTSAGNPNQMSTGKKVFWIAVIGLALALGTKVIINWILTAVGYTGTPLS